MLCVTLFTVSAFFTHLGIHVHLHWGEYPKPKNVVNFVVIQLYNSFCKRFCPSSRVQARREGGGVGEVTAPGPGDLRGGRG